MLVCIKDLQAITFKGPNYAVQIFQIEPQGSKNIFKRVLDFKARSLFSLWLLFAPCLDDFRQHHQR